MFGFGAKKQDQPSLLQRLGQGLKKTRAKLGSGLAHLFLGKKVIDQALLEELESLLISADLGMAATQDLLAKLRQSIAREALQDPTALIATLKKLMIELLSQHQSPLQPENHHPFVILMVGVNGAGKTTTSGKLASHFRKEGRKVLFAAGDTFRAAAIEQLEAWGAKNDIPIIAQPTGADAAAVCFDALQAAKARHMDIVIADTAGRLHTQDHLMKELAKIKRVLQKQDASAPHEVLLVLDASIGQNALQQAKLFNEAIGLTGICMTKLDGTAKGGILFSVAHTLQLPIRYIGVGEDVQDLQVFDPAAFVDALFEDAPA